MARGQQHALEHLTQWGWVSLADFARILGVHVATVYYMHKQGKISPVKVGKTYRVEMNEVRRVLRERDSQGKLSLSARGSPPTGGLSSFLPDRRS